MSEPDIFETLPDRQTLPYGGGLLSYRERGHGQPVILLHGLLGCADSWVEQFGRLNEDYRVIAWDAPGYGASSICAPELAAFADALAALIQGLNATDAVLVGHSMGGVVSTAYAARADASLSRLVLSCTHSGYAAPADSAPTEKLRDRIRELNDLGPEAYGKLRADGMVAPQAGAEVRAMAAHIAAQTQPDGLFNATRMLQFADARPLYARIKTPTTVIFGGEDPVVRPDMSDELRKLTPFADHVILPGVGHAPYLEDASAFNAILTENEPQHSTQSKQHASLE